MRYFLLCVLLLFSLPASAEIIFSFSGPFSGDTAAYGEQIKAGAGLAVADLNAKGGLLGQKVIAKMEDDGCDAKQAVAVANRVAAQNPRPAIMFGSLCSMAVIPTMEIYAEEQIVQFPFGTNDKITEPGISSLFRITAPDHYQADMMAAHLAKSFQGKKIALIHDKKVWGKGIIDAIEGKLDKKNFAKIETFAINAGERDFSVLVTKLKAEKFDAVAMGLFPIEAGGMMRQANDQGYQAQFFGFDALLTSEFWSVAGKAGNGIIFTGPRNPEYEPGGKELLARFKAAGYKPET
ncbi:MAG: branched-chain amino acid ABC transporter substrate-binding protein, partial [Dongiaceae bacterium]